MEHNIGANLLACLKNYESNFQLQEAQFEQLTRELEAERQKVAHKVQQVGKKYILSWNLDMHSDLFFTFYRTKNI